MGPHSETGRRTTVDGRDEGGYVLPMTAMLLIPLMIFAALATDVGAWYIRADQAQKAADAAALAGTVWLPDQSMATTVALDVAARNGFRDPAWVAANGGVANADITVSETDGKLRVDIVSTTPSYFGSVVLDDIDIERRAIGAVTQAVRMGNPSNGLGTGNLSVDELGIPPDGVWLSLNGRCQDHQQGDPISVSFYGAVQAGGNFWDACNSANLGVNPTFDSDGYIFVVDVPPGAGQVNLEVLEPGLCNDADTSDTLYSASDASATGPRLNFRVYANDNTLLNHADNLVQTPVVDTLFPTNACTGGVSVGGGRWYTIYNIPAGAANEGRWYIQANVRSDVAERSLNNFALRARPSGDTQLCSSMTDPACPDLYALEWLSVYRPNFGGGAMAGMPAEFFLAEVDEVHAGKSLEITLFDPGEGMNNIKFLDPAGTVVSFEQRLANCTVGGICGHAYWPETANGPDDDCSGVPCLDVTGNRFQGQWVVATVDLPAGYSCGGNCWWRVRYTPNSTGTVTDRTTWGVRVVGGPVHLVE